MERRDRRRPSAPGPADGSPPTAAASGPARGIGRLAVPFSPEDVLVFAWVVGLEALLVRRFGRELALLSTGAWEPAWLVWLTAGGLAVALFTRGPADTDMHQAASRRCVISVILWLGARAWLGGQGSWSGALLLWAVVGFVVLAPLQQLDRLPRTGLGLRRVLVLPAQLVGSSMFAAQVTPEFLRGGGGPGAPAAALAGPLVLAAFLFLYAVVGPRVLAGEPWTPLGWLARFALYVGALWLGRPAWAGFGR
jgi:hypothetical protein